MGCCSISPLQGTPGCSFTVPQGAPEQAGAATTPATTGGAVLSHRTGRWRWVTLGECPRRVSLPARSPPVSAPLPEPFTGTKAAALNTTTFPPRRLSIPKGKSKFLSRGNSRPKFGLLGSHMAQCVLNSPVSLPLPGYGYLHLLVCTNPRLHTQPRGSPSSSTSLCTPSLPGSSWKRPHETLDPVWGGVACIGGEAGGWGWFSASLQLSAELSSEAGLIPFRAWLPSSGWCLGS